MASKLDSRWRQNAVLVELPGGLIRMMMLILSVVAGTSNIYLSLAGRRNMTVRWIGINIELPTLPWISYRRG